MTQFSKVIVTAGDYLQAWHAYDFLLMDQQFNEELEARVTVQQ